MEQLTLAIQNIKETIQLWIDTHAKYELNQVAKSTSDKAFNNNLNYLIETIHNKLQENCHPNQSTFLFTVVKFAAVDYAITKREEHLRLQLEN